jgi:hypothetical protein
MLTLSQGSAVGCVQCAPVRSQCRLKLRKSGVWCKRAYKCCPRSASSYNASVMWQDGIVSIVRFVAECLDILQTAVAVASALGGWDRCNSLSPSRLGPHVHNLQIIILSHDHLSPANVIRATF